MTVSDSRSLPTQQYNVAISSKHVGPTGVIHCTPRKPAAPVTKTPAQIESRNHMRWRSLETSCTIPLSYTRESQHTEGSQNMP
eukprot:356293-Chlamydomonas_euryale.AAC.1